MIYLDAAATTLEKPPQVRQAMAQAAAELSTPGRGSHPAARRAEEKRVSALGVIQNYAGANSAGIAREIGGRDLFLTLRRS